MWWSKFRSWRRNATPEACWIAKSGYRKGMGIMSRADIEPSSLQVQYHGARRAEDVRWSAQCDHADISKITTEWEEGGRCAFAWKSH